MNMGNYNQNVKNANGSKILKLPESMNKFWYQSLLFELFASILCEQIHIYKININQRLSLLVKSNLSIFPFLKVRNNVETIILAFEGRINFIVFIYKANEKEHEVDEDLWNREELPKAQGTFALYQHNR